MQSIPRSNGIDKRETFFISTFGKFRGLLKFSIRVPLLPDTPSIHEVVQTFASYQLTESAIADLETFFYLRRVVYDLAHR